MSVCVLIIDDSADDRALIKRALAGLVEAREVGSLTEARSVLADSQWQPDAILLDVGLPDGEGERGGSLSAVRELSETAPVIVCTGQMLSDCPELSVQARAAGAADFTSKSLILFEPASLIRQIDWVITPPIYTPLPPPGTERHALRQRAMRSMEIRYDPNDIPAMLSRMLQRQDDMHEANQRTSAERKLQLEAILTQTTKTNGRVTAMEGWRDTLNGSAKFGGKVGGILMVAVMFIFGPQIKDRCALDTSAVRRIFIEEFAAQVAKTLKPTPP